MISKKVRDNLYAEAERKVIHKLEREILEAELLIASQKHDLDIRQAKIENKEKRLKQVEEIQARRNKDLCSRERLLERIEADADVVLKG